MAALPQEAELRSGLLTIDDMPTGWAEVPDAGDEEADTSPCGIKFAKLLDLDVEHLPSAEVQFAEDADTGPWIQEQLGYVPEGRGEQAFSLLAAAVAECDRDEIDGTTVTLSELSFPTVGDDSLAFRMRLEDAESEQTVDIDIVELRLGDLFVAVAAFDMFGDATELLRDYIPMAVDRASSVLLGHTDSKHQAPARPNDFQTFTGDIFTVELLDTKSTAVEVRFCATAPYQNGSIPVSRRPWNLRDQNGTLWPAARDAVDLPGNAYPVEATVSVGDCLQGWIRFDAPASTIPSSVVYRSSIGGPFTWDLDTTGASTLPSGTPAETDAGWNLPRGFPKIVPVSSLPDQIRNWYQLSGNEKAVAVAPGVWAELPPGATMTDTIEAEVFDGFCASKIAFEQEYLTGDETPGTCW